MMRSPMSELLSLKRVNDPSRDASRHFELAFQIPEELHVRGTRRLRFGSFDLEAPTIKARGRFVAPIPMARLELYFATAK